MRYSPSTGGFYTPAIHGTAIPPDAVEITTAAHAALLDGQAAGKRIVANQSGQPILQDPPAPTTAQTIARYEKALDDHLDGVAKLHRYRDRFTFAQRATRPGPWYAEGCAFYDWMETCNAQAFALLSEVQAGNAVMPTIDAFIDSLPEFSL